MFETAGPCVQSCATRALLDVIRGKWAILILCCLKHGPVRNGALLRAVPGISQRVLTQTLRELERDGLVARISYSEMPPRVEYRLTELGQSFSELARAIEHWFVVNYPAILAPRRRSTEHAADTGTEP